MKTFTLTILLLSACYSNAFAQYGGGGGGHGGHGGSGGFNEDGSFEGRGRVAPKPPKPITKAEFETMVRAQFAEADLNHDGYVSLDEIQQAINAKRDARIADKFAEIDTNHDGTISRDEFFAWQRKLGDPWMQHSEADPDGAPAGARAADREEADHNGARGWRHNRGEHGEGIGLIMAPMSANLVVEADTNHDGLMSLAEDLAYQDARFDKADTDHDGTIDADEMRAAREARAAAER